MKDRLEEYIRMNREEFEIYTPGENVWEGIRKPAVVIPERKKYLKIAYRIAAVIIIFIASYAFHEYRDYRSEMKLADENESIYRQIPDLRETEFYYNNLVDLKLEELKPFFRQVPGLESEIKYDLSELDSIYASLKNDLKDNIANDQVLEAMIQNYRLKLEILEDLLSEVKHEKSKNDETPKSNT